MPTTPDHYTTLSLPRNATSSDIKRAFRRLAILHHPDKLKLKQPSPNTPTSTSTSTTTDTNIDTAAPFRTIRTAYETLIDPASRRRYDASLASLASRQSSMFADEEEEEEDADSEWNLFCADWEEARGWARRFEEELEKGRREGEGEGRKGNVERCFGVEELRAWEIGKGMGERSERKGFFRDRRSGGMRGGRREMDGMFGDLGIRG